ncbi:methyltransferase [Pluteus cervinus]|uniref:Methyltransferase n=1 Tax=Pluteus cervinus TaxID=181527 RepID=A0ACD3B067_9AGAR|nr:methyltransferase [Pluteus cervinus]
MKTTSSVHDVAEELPAFGARFLTDESKVWEHNAWDHVPYPVDQRDNIEAKLQTQRSAPVPQEDHLIYNRHPSRHWDNFYKSNAENFFRNRKWLHNEFPELVAASQPDAGPKVIAEIGCGAGNSVFPVLSSNSNPHLLIKAYDYSSHAIKLVTRNPQYASPPIGSIHAAVWDITSSTGLPPDLEPASVDVVILVFVLSALHPDEWQTAINNVHQMLKPGGLVVLRDYGRHDLTQLRFKSGRLLEENFYIRGDKTRVYFFEIDELSLMFTGSLPHGNVDITTTEEVEDDAKDGQNPSLGPVLAPTGTSISSSIHNAEDASSSIPTIVNNETVQPHPPIIHPNLLQSNAGNPLHALFKAEQLGVDRRLLVNRKRQLKMYRVWMQGQFRKI